MSLNLIALTTSVAILEAAYNHACSEFPEHTFVMRKAPYRSIKFEDGNVYAELRCSGTLKASHPLVALGIEYQEVERWIHPVKRWKLLRFTVTNHTDLLMLHNVCGSPDIESRDVETQEWLSAIAAENLSKKDLVILATDAGIKSPSRLTKVQLKEALGIPSIA